MSDWDAIARYRTDELMKSFRQSRLEGEKKVAEYLLGVFGTEVTEMAVPNECITYLHCGKCVDEWKTHPEGAGVNSPKDFARLNVGWTQTGLQVWCVRHEVNVCHIDFEGKRHPAEMNA